MAAMLHRASTLTLKNVQRAFTLAPRCFARADAALPRRPESADAPSLMDIGTRSIYAEEHDIFRRSMRKFLQEEVAPRQREWDHKGFIDREMWHRFGQQGLLGIMVPEELGGHGGDYLTENILIEELFYLNHCGYGFVLSSTLCAPYLVQLGTQEQLEKFMPRLVQGECIFALAMTEPGAGSDVQGIRTNAKKDGDDWILNGSKTFITNGYLADAIIVAANTNPEAKTPAHGLSLFIVEEGMKGFTRGKPLEKMGSHLSDTAELFFDDVRLPPHAMLGEVAHGFKYLMQNLPNERLGIASISVSHSKFMFEETREYIKQRKAFGHTLSALQTIQHKMAEMKTEIVITQAFVDRCIVLHNAGELSSQMASMAKYWASDLSKRVADQCVQLHGGWGYMMEMPIARAFTGARVTSIFGGTNEIMKELIAREIVKK